eukprot:COSAG06_NODE_3645_length_5078_cov_4.545089_2_plen_132_part_00
MPSGTYRGAKVAAERGDPLPLVCNCAHDDCVCPDGRHPPPAALALSNKRKAAMASIAEWYEEDEDEDEEYWMNRDQGSANSNSYEEESSDNLGRHMLSHMGERPCACTWPGCDHAATTKWHLKRHSKQHSG